MDFQLIFKEEKMIKKNILIIASTVSLITTSAFNAYGAAEPAQNQTLSPVQGEVNPQLAAPTVSAPELTQTIQVTYAWARKSLSPNNNSAAYMKINNPTDKDIVIIGASASDTANNVELHKSFVDEKGVSRMSTIDKIVIPAKTTVELAPSATHIMLFDLKKNLNAGDKFNIELKIEGEIKSIIVETEVK